MLNKPDFLKHVPVPVKCSESVTLFSRSPELRIQLEIYGDKMNRILFKSLSFITKNDCVQFCFSSRICRLPAALQERRIYDTHKISWWVF